MGRQARRYKYRVDVNEYISQDDGYDGYIATQGPLLATVWADIVVLSADNLEDFGLDVGVKVIRIFVRKHQTIDYFRNDIAFDWKGDIYKPFNVAERTPGVEFEILANAIE